MADVLDFEVRMKVAEEDIRKLNNQLHSIANNAEKTGDQMDDAFKKVGKTIGAVFATSQLIDFGKQIVNVRKEIESYEISFRTLLGSQEKADALFGSLREFAVKTPMQLGDLAKGAQTLLGFGIEAEKIMPTLKQIGDISMGNAEKFGSLTLAFAQMSSSGKLMGQDLLQMINAGFNPLQVISEKTGKSIGELKKEMEQGAISVEMVADAFKTATSEGGMFYGMLEKQSEGLQGAISNLQGAWEEALNTLGERSQGLIVSGIKGATKLVENFDNLISVIMGVASAFGMYKAVLISINIGETIAKFNELRKTLTRLEAAQKALNITAMKNPYILLASAIVGVGVALLSFARNMNDAKKEQDDFNKTLGDRTNGTITKLEKMSKEWEKLGNNFQAKEQYIIDNKSAFEELGKAVGSVAEAEDLLIKNKDKFKEAIIEKAKAGLYQAKAEELIAKQVENEQEIAKLNPEVTKTRKIKGKLGSYRLEYYKEKNPRIKELEDENAELQKQIDEYLDKAISGESEGDKPTKDYQKINDEITKYTNLIKETSQKIADLRSGKIESTNLLGDIEAEEKKLDEYTKTLETLLGKQEKVTATTFAQEAQEQAQQMEDENFQNRLRHEAELARVRNESLEEYYKKEQLAIDNEYQIKVRNIEKERAEALKNAKGEDKEAINLAYDRQLKEAENAWMLNTEKNTQQKELNSYNERLNTYQKFVEEYLRIEQDRESRIKEIRERVAKGEMSAEEGANREYEIENIVATEKAALREELGLTSDEIVAEVVKTVTATVAMGINEIRAQLPGLKAELNALKASGGDPALIAKLEAQIKVMENELEKAKKGTDTIAKESKGDWGIVVNSLSAVNQAIGEVTNAFGDMMSESGKTAVNVMQTTLQATTSVIGAISVTGETAFTAMKAAEQASVILAIISASVQVIMAITNALIKNFSAQAKYEKAMEDYNRELDEIEAKQKRIDYENSKKVGVEYWNSMANALGNYNKQLEVLRKKEEDQKKRLQEINEKQKRDYTPGRGYEGMEKDAEEYAKNTITKKEQEVIDDLAGTTEQITEVEQRLFEAQQEIMEQMATTNATSLGETMASSIVDAFSKGLEGMTKAFDKSVDDLLKSMLEQRLALQLADQFKGAFDYLTTATTESKLDKALKAMGLKGTDSVLIDDQEMTTFLEMINNAKEGALTLSEEYQKLFAELGLLDDTIDAESKGFQTMSQDTGDELNGRFTALQISGANIEATLRQQMQIDTEALQLSKTISEDISLMTGIANAQLQELKDISRNTSLLEETNTRLKRIEDNTARL